MSLLTSMLGQRIFRGLFRIVGTNLSAALRHPLRHEAISFRVILVLVAKKSACISRENLYLARPREPRSFVSLQPF